MEAIREYPSRGRGSLLKAVREMAEYARNHPESVEPDAYGKCHMFRLGPYFDDAAAVSAARTMRGYGPEYGGRVESYSKRYDGRPYAVARFVPEESTAPHEEMV